MNVGVSPILVFPDDPQLRRLFCLFRRPSHCGLHLKLFLLLVDLGLMLLQIGLLALFVAQQVLV